jgi:hypothetical protein
MLKKEEKIKISDNLLESLLNYVDDKGMSADVINDYGAAFKSKNGRDLDPEKDMVKVGTYDTMTYDTTGLWSKFSIKQEDIGSGFDLILHLNDIYVETGNISLTDKSYRDVFIDIVKDFFGENTPVSFSFPE